MTIYKSSTSRAAVLAAYERRLAQLPLPVESCVVATRFGDTHLLAAGPPDGPPLLLIPGTNGNALDFAEPFGFFAERHRCFFVDVVGEPGRSSETQPSKADDSYGRWVGDVLDGIGIARAAMFGMSLGGYVILKSAVAIPERIERAVLIVPEGFSRASTGSLLGALFWPLLRHRIAPTDANARRIAAALSRPAPPSDAAVRQLGFAFEHVAGGVRLGKLLEAGELARCRAPMLVVAGGRDILYPGEVTLARARQVLPNLRDAILVPDANHISADLFAAPVVQRIRDFLAE